MKAFFLTESTEQLLQASEAICNVLGLNKFVKYSDETVDSKLSSGGFIATRLVKDEENERGAYVFLQNSAGDFVVGVLYTSEQTQTIETPEDHNEVKNLF